MSIWILVIIMSSSIGGKTSVGVEVLAFEKEVECTSLIKVTKEHFAEDFDKVEVSCIEREL